MKHRFIDLAFDITVFPLQFFKVVGKRHDWCSLSWFLERTVHSRFHRWSVL
jgi:hypothetical protein